MQIAKRLAIAVLQFQATAWLGESWSSQEVWIPHSANDSASICEDGQGPFLNVSIRNAPGPSASSSKNPSRTVVRNPLLFDLGVMMLELAYQKPLVELRKPQDTGQYEDHNTDYFTADRIRHQVSRYMGPRYAEVARKCIHCDFEQDSDLNRTELQEGFHQNVICVLEELEEVFRKFKLSI